MQVYIKKDNFLSSLYKFPPTLDGQDPDYICTIKSITRKDVENEVSFTLNHITNSGSGPPSLNTEKPDSKTTKEEKIKLSNN